MNTTQFKTGKMALLLGLGLGAVISAQGQEVQRERQPKNPPTFSELLEKMDSEKDGKLAAGEVKGRLKKMFSKIDTNEDGFITEEEYNNAPKPEKKQRSSN